MKISVDLRVLKVEDAKDAMKFLGEVGVAVRDANSHVTAEVSKSQWEALERYQSNPHLPRFCYPQ